MPTITSSIVQGSGGSGASWVAALGTDGGGNLAADPLLGALQNNGGFTPTRMPGAGSSAVDAVACLAGITMDQRGFDRPQGSTCDIGAVEVRQGSFALNVAVSGSGSGTVSCGSGPCPAAPYPFVENLENQPTNVTLSAAPAAGSAFTGWSDACAGTSATCIVTMDQARSVTAAFSMTHTLTITPPVNGSLACSSGGNPVISGAVLLEGSTVDCNAAPDAHYVLSAWSGACGGTGACSFAMTGDQSVGASFALVVVPVTPVPTLGQWMLAALALALLGLAGCGLRRQQVR